MSEKTKSQQFFNTIEQFISKIFLCPNIMYKHIDFMRCFPDIEWFNVAAILLQKPDAIFVKSKAAWDEYCDKDVLIRKGAKSIRVAIPEEENGVLQFSLIPIFDISDINFKNEIIISSPIKIKVDSYDGISNMNTLFSNINTSLSECLIASISNQPFFIEQNEGIQNTILGYVLKSIESFLNEEITVKPLEEFNNALEIYDFIHECIYSIPQFIDNSLSSIVYREQEKKEQKDLYKIATRSIEARKRAAFNIVNTRILNTGKEILNIHESYQEEFDEDGIPIPTEREVYS